jgi:hypothetical protein
MSYTYRAANQLSSPFVGGDFAFTQFSPLGANRGNGGTEQVMVFIDLMMDRESYGGLKPHRLAQWLHLKLNARKL